MTCNQLACVYRHSDQANWENPIELYLVLRWKDVSGEENRYFNRKIFTLLR